MSHPAFAGRFFVAIGSYSQLHRSFQRLETLGLTFTHVTDKADYALLWFEPGRAAAQQRQDLEQRGIKLIYVNRSLELQFAELKWAYDREQAAAAAARARAEAAAAAERAAKEAATAAEKAAKVAAQRAAREAAVAEAQRAWQAAEAEKNKQAQLNAGLQVAAQLGDLAEVKHLLEQGAQVNALDDYGTPVLVNATVYGHLEVVLELMRSGANVKAAGKQGATALHAAVLKHSGPGHMVIAVELLKAGIDGDARTAMGCTALHYAVEQGHLDMLAVLISAKVNLEATTQNGCTALYLAAERHQLEAVTMLLNAGAKVQSTLSTAAEKGNIDIIKDILDLHNNNRPAAAAWVAAADGSTALHKAAGRGHVSIVERLLQAGAPVSAADHQGATALHQASHYGHAAVVERLLQAGAPMDAAATGGVTPLMLACLQGDFSIVQRLLEAGVNVNATTAAHDTALTKAASKGLAQVCAALIAAGAAVCATNDNGQCCLTLAASGGFTAIVQQALAVWPHLEDAPQPVQDLLVKAVECAAAGTHWDACVLLIKELSRSDLPAAEQLCKQYHACAPALLTAILQSSGDKQQAAMLERKRELAQQRLDVQQLTLSVAGEHKRAVSTAASSAALDAMLVLPAGEDAAAASAPCCSAAAGTPAAANAEEDGAAIDGVPVKGCKQPSKRSSRKARLAAMGHALVQLDSKRQRVK